MNIDHHVLFEPKKIGVTQESQEAEGEHPSIIQFGGLVSPINT